MPRTMLLLCLALLCVVPFASAQKAEEGSFERTLNVSGPVQLHVSTGSGSIVVRSGNAGAVRVSARIRVGTRWGFSDSNAAVRVKEIENNPPIRQTGNIITIGNEVQRWDNVSISYDIMTPQPTQVTASSGSGTVEASGVRGPAELNTGSGQVRADNIGGGVRAHSGSGGITIDGAAGPVSAGTGSGSIQVSRVEGNVEATTASGTVTVSGATGRVNARSASGSVSVQKAQMDVEARTASGNISIDGRPKGARWDAEAASGRINVSLPAGTGFEVDAESHSGGVTTSHPVSATGTQQRRALRGVAGKPDNKLYLRTGSGTIRID